ncbi:MAG TPA: sugar ABC transporter permease [Acidimicrobiia bacterium]|jgi:multiple sugar transport system permease protein|nr:sugar ABC transporter permease [Acidimicrobiia bacterium]
MTQRAAVATEGATAARLPDGAGRQRRGAKQNLIGWSFALPFLVLFAVFVAGPILASLGMSFTDMRIADIRNPFAVDIVGFENYAALFQDERFLRAAANTAYFVVVAMPLTMAAGLAIALGLNQAIVKFRTVFRVGFYLPVVASVVAISVVWRLILNEETGLINGILGVFGIDGPGWLTTPELAMPSIIAMTVWRNLGYQMVIFLAGLQAIPLMLYEAADIDGANRWAKFRYVTLPLLRPTLLFSAVITLIGYLQFFEEPFVMTEGGPLDATLSVSMYVINQFGFGNYGYAASISYVLFLAIAVLTFIVFRFLRPQD